MCGLNARAKTETCLCLYQLRPCSFNYVYYVLFIKLLNNDTCGDYVYPSFPHHSRRKKASNSLCNRELGFRQKIINSVQMHENKGTFTNIKKEKGLNTLKGRKACMWGKNLNIAFGLHPVTLVGMVPKERGLRHLSPRGHFISLVRIARNTSQNMPELVRSGHHLSCFVFSSANFMFLLFPSHSHSLTLIIMLFISKFVCEINFGFQLLCFPYHLLLQCSRVLLSTSLF